MFICAAQWPNAARLVNWSNVVRVWPNAQMTRRVQHVLTISDETSHDSSSCYNDALTRFLASRCYHTGDEDGDEDDSMDSFTRHHIDNLPARTSSQTGLYTTQLVIIKNLPKHFFFKKRLLCRLNVTLTRLS